MVGLVSLSKLIQTVPDLEIICRCHHTIMFLKVEYQAKVN